MHGNVPILAVHKRDGHVVKRFESIKDAAEWAEVDPHCVADGSRNNAVGLLEVMWRREDRWGGSEVFKEGSHGRPVAIMGNGRIHWFPTISDAAAAMGTTNNAVSQAIKAKKTMRCGYQVAYMNSTEDWPRLKERFDVRSRVE